MDEIALTVKNLTKRYGKFSMENVSLSLERGYILGLVGRNGAGKSTFMKSLLNPSFSDSGDITIFNIDAKKNPYLAKQQIGVLMEELPFLKNRCLEDNGRMLGAFYEQFNMDTFFAYLRKFELGRGALYSELSAGMRMKFQLAFALAHKPKLLLMDEATGGLDVVFRREFFYLLQEAVEKEMVSVIISTHVTEDLDKIADYIACIDHGKLKFYQTKEDLYEKYIAWQKQCGRRDEAYLKDGSPKLEDIIYEYDCFSNEKRSTVELDIG